MREYTPILIALIFNAFDIITGVISAVRIKKIQSAKLRDGLFKKVGFVMCYLLAWIVDTYGSAIGFKLAFPILPVIILYVCTTEMVSIIENISKINPDILPEKLKELFHITEIDGGS